MKPAPSIIGFTTSSGLGYGLLFTLATGGILGLVPTDRWLGVVGFLLALLAITAGLLSSTFHLGHPERAWRALSQWRSSWLSREGLLALITYIPTMILAAGWVIGETLSGMIGLVAALTAPLALMTVYCTGMIYADLPPIRAWHQPLTAPIYVAFALMTGLLALNWLLTVFGAPHQIVGILTLLAIALAFGLKILYWQKLKTEADGGSPTIASATGLGSGGLVRMLDPPHTQTNYLLEEMGFQIARKHGRRLRMLTLAFGLFGPIILTLISLVSMGWAATMAATSALLLGVLGVLIERWLFFAEAEHTVMLYYGENSVSFDQATSLAPAKAGIKSRSKPAAPVRRRRAPPEQSQAILREEQGQS